MQSNDNHNSPLHLLRFLNLSELEEPIERPRPPLRGDRSVPDIVPWYAGDNLFPNRLAERARSSSTHAGILAGKISLTQGDGFNCTGPDAESVQEWTARVNPMGESLAELWTRMATDWWHFGNAFLEIVLNEGRLELYHRDATTCRLLKGKEGLAESVCIRPEWNGGMLREDKGITLPLWPRMSEVDGLTGLRAVFHLRKYAPQYAWYGLPDYIAAYWNGWLDIDYRIPRYNLARFRNGFRPGGILHFEGSFASKLDIQAFMDELEIRHIGEENTGKLMTLVSDRKGLEPKFVPWEDAPEGAFETLQKLCVQNIITAHRWSPALCGIQMAGSLGSNQQVRLEHERVMSSVIKPEQDLLLRPIQLALSRAGFRLDSLTVSNTTPLSYFGQLPLEKLITVNEAREHIGYGPLGEEPVVG